MNPFKLMMLKASKESYFLMSIAMLVFLLTLPSQLMAQDDPAAEPAAVGAATTAAAAAPSQDTSILDVIKQGGIWMVPLFVLLLAAMALIVMNFISLQRKKLTGEAIMPDLLQQLADRDIDGAMSTCARNPSLMTNILEGGLNRLTTDDIDIDSIQEGLDQTGKAQMAKMIKSINYLTNIGSVAPMVGLLGTVSGMIKAFQGLSAGGGADAERMAANISEALVTTASGLVIAIPAMLFYFYFKNNFMQTLSEIDAEIGRLLNALRTGSVSYSVSQDNEPA